MATGYLSLIIGPMFSSKTTYLLSELTTLADTGIKCLFINSNLDDRKTSGDNLVSTHSSHYYKFSERITAIKCNKLADVDVKEYRAIAIDECQFYDDLYSTVQTWINSKNKIVFCAGLDGDRDMKPFGQTLQLIPLADKVEKKIARCRMCSRRSDSIVSVPAPFTYGKTKGSQIEIGSSDIYQAVCRYHYFELNSS